MKKWNRELAWPRKSDYILRCLDEVFGPSNGGNPMVTLKFEVAGPESVEIDGEEVSVAGIPLTFWCVTKSVNGHAKATPEEATAQAQKNFIKLLEAFELPTDNIDWDNPTLGFKGKTVYALLEDNLTEQRGSPTKADLAKGIKQGPVLMNPKTKKPLMTHYPKIVEIFGIAGTAGSL